MPSYSGEYKSLYDGVFSRHPDVLAIEETEDKGFPKALLYSMERLSEDVGAEGFICFCVDDLIFIDRVDFR